MRSPLFERDRVCAPGKSHSSKPDSRQRCPDLCACSCLAGRSDCGTGAGLEWPACRFRNCRQREAGKPARGRKIQRARSEAIKRSAADTARQTSKRRQHRTHIRSVKAAGDGLSAPKRWRESGSHSKDSKTREIARESSPLRASTLCVPVVTSMMLCSYWQLKSCLRIRNLSWPHGRLSGNKVFSKCGVCSYRCRMNRSNDAQARHTTRALALINSFSF